jgi:hypothetical protein
MNRAELETRRALLTFFCSEAIKMRAPAFIF